MGIKMVDTAEPMNETGYPVARAKHIWFDDSESLQKKLDNGSLSGGGGGYTQLSQAEYDALTDDEKMNGKEYRTYDTGHIYRLGVEFGKDADISRSEVLKTYVSLYDLNTKKGLSLAWENNVDNTQKIIDALEGREEFIDSFSSSTNRIGIVGNYGTTINNFHIIKRSADLSIITATTNDGTILNRTYTNGTLSDWCVNIAVYTSLAELGLTAPTTVGDIFNAMPGSSMAVIACEGREGNTEGAAVHVSDVPVSFGVLTIKKNQHSRFSIEYQNSLAGAACNVKRWIGTLKGNDGTGLYWKQVNTGNHKYTTMAELTLDGSTATIQDVMDKVAVGDSVMIRTDAFNNNNWQTQCNGIQWGYLKIEKTQNGLSNIELQEVVVPNRRYFGTQSSGKFAGWVATTYTKGLVSNAQNFKLDITKNNAAWYGFFKLEYLYGTELCQVDVGIANTIDYKVTKGTNYIDKITYTVNGTSIVLGIDFIGKVYGVQVVEMPSEFGTINSLTAETYAGDTTANLKLDSARTYTTLAELGLTTDATFQDVISALPKGSSALLGVTEFTNYQTIFPYKEGNDQFARVYIVKGSADGSRMYARWFRKDGVKEAIAKFSINDNKFAGWQSVIVEKSRTDPYSCEGYTALTGTEDLFTLPCGHYVSDKVNTTYNYPITDTSNVTAHIYVLGCLNDPANNKGYRVILYFDNKNRMYRINEWWGSFSNGWKEIVSKDYVDNAVSNSGNTFNGKEVKSITIDLSASAFQVKGTSLYKIALDNYISANTNVIKVEGYYVPPTDANSTYKDKRYIVHTSDSDRAGGIRYYDGSWTTCVCQSESGSKKGSGFAKIYYIN